MRFLRYLVVQCIAYGLDLGGFLLLFSVLGANPLPANAAGKIVAGVFAFLAHRSFTFRLTGKSPQPRQVIGYCILLALNIPLSSAVLFVFMQFIPLAIVAKVAADAICIGITYTLSRKYVFRDQSAPPATATQQESGS
jgi:putative flippase GtrA